MEYVKASDLIAHKLDARRRILESGVEVAMKPQEIYFPLPAWVQTAIRKSFTSTRPRLQVLNQVWMLTTALCAVRLSS